MKGHHELKNSMVYAIFKIFSYNYPHMNYIDIIRQSSRVN